MRPCIASIIKNYDQQDATFLDLFISTDALHVSGGSSAHHQEHIAVHTASGIVNQ
jgi:predicted nucleic-acid-binding protein